MNVQKPGAVESLDFSGVALTERRILKLVAQLHLQLSVQHLLVCEPALAHLGSLEFTKQLLTHAGVAVAPGVGYGEDGEGFVRIAMVENEQRIRQAARNVKKFLAMRVNEPAQLEIVK